MDRPQAGRWFGVTSLLSSSSIIIDHHRRRHDHDHDLVVIIRIIIIMTHHHHRHDHDHEHHHYHRGERIFQSSHHCEYFSFCEMKIDASTTRTTKKEQYGAPYQDGARGENLRPKIATMAAGRRTRAAPDGQTRRESFFIANSAGKRTTTLSTNNNLTQRRPRRPRRRESVRENRNDGSRATNESGPGRAGAGAPRQRSF